MADRCQGRDGRQRRTQGWHWSLAQVRKLKREEEVRIPYHSTIESLCPFDHVTLSLRLPPVHTWLNALYSLFLSLSLSSFFSLSASLFLVFSSVLFFLTPDIWPTWTAAVSSDVNNNHRVDFHWQLSMMLPWATTRLSILLEVTLGEIA